jgi:hypothetical protein
MVKFMTLAADRASPASTSPESPTIQAAKNVENFFDKTIAFGAEDATAALISEINSNPSQASAILKQIAQDDQTNHDNVLPAIALTSAGQMLLTAQLDNGVFTLSNLPSIIADPPAESDGEKAVLAMSAQYLTDNFANISGMSADSPPSWDQLSSSVIYGLDLYAAEGSLNKSPGWAAPQKTYNPPLYEKILDNI